MPCSPLQAELKGNPVPPAGIVCFVMVMLQVGVGLGVPVGVVLGVALGVGVHVGVRVAVGGLVGVVVGVRVGVAVGVPGLHLPAEPALKMLWISGCVSARSKISSSSMVIGSSIVLGCHPISRKIKLTREPKPGGLPTC